MAQADLKSLEAFDSCDKSWWEQSRIERGKRALVVLVQLADCDVKEEQSCSWEHALLG